MTIEQWVVAHPLLVHPGPLRIHSLRIHTNVQRFRGRLVFKAHRLCVSLNSRLEIDKEEEEVHRADLIARNASHTKPRVLKF